MTTSPVPSDTDRLAEIRARLDAATPGPWTRFGREIGNEDGDSWFLGHDIEGPPEAQRGQFERVADAELIAHAPADLEWLLSERERLLAHNGVLVTEVRFQAERADEQKELVASLQARLTAAEEQLATAKEIHKPEQRFTPDDGETSYDTYTDAAEVSKVTGIAPTHFEVCEHCGSIEMDAGATEYRDSLWPCDTARALGLGEGDSR